MFTEICISNIHLTSTFRFTIQITTRREGFKFNLLSSRSILAFFSTRGASLFLLEKVSSRCATFVSQQGQENFISLRNTRIFHFIPDISFSFGFHKKRWLGKLRTEIAHFEIVARLFYVRI